jgi:hypothetical protein
VLTQACAAIESPLLVTVRKSAHHRNNNPFPSSDAMKFAARTALSLLTLTAAGLTQAQAPVVKQAPTEKPATPDVAKIDFATLDKDANGNLSKQEVLPVPELEGVFATLDTDHNGSVSAVEFSHWSRAGKSTPVPRDPTTAPGGSAGAQHMPKRD